MGSDCVQAVGFVHLEYKDYGCCKHHCTYDLKDLVQCLGGLQASSSHCFVR